MTCDKFFVCIICKELLRIILSVYFLMLWVICLYIILNSVQVLCFSWSIWIWRNMAGIDIGALDNSKMVTPFVHLGLAWVKLEPYQRRVHVFCTVKIVLKVFCVIYYGVTQIILNIKHEQNESAMTEHEKYTIPTTPSLPFLHHPSCHKVSLLLTGVPLHLLISHRARNILFCISCWHYAIDQKECTAIHCTQCFSVKSREW